MTRFDKAAGIVAAVAFFVAALYIGLPFLSAIVVLDRGIRASHRHEQLVHDAQAFGRSRTAEACVREAVARADRCTDWTCATEAQDFLSWSLTTAPDRDAFCRALPHTTAEEERWLNDECRRRSRGLRTHCVNAMRAAYVTCRATF